MEKQYRKLQHLLIDAGMGTILFGVWGVVKVNMYLSLSSFFVNELAREAGNYGVDKRAILTAVMVILVLTLLFYLLIRLYIGMAAMAEGKGKDKGNGYLIVTAIVLVTTLTEIWNIYIRNSLLTSTDLSLDNITGFLMELAAVYVLAEVLVIGIRMKRMRKKMKE